MNAPGRADGWAWRAVAAAAVVAALLAGFAFAATPLDAILRDWSSDDSYYYARIARHLAAGDGPTFDGMQPTNGHHPLWLWLQVPLQGLFADRELALRATRALEVLLALAGVLCFARALRRAAVPAAAGAVLLLFAVQTGLLYQGLETGLLVAMLGLCLLLLVRAVERPSPVRRLALGAGLLLAALARIEVLALAPWLAWWATGAEAVSARRRLAHAVVLLLPVGAGALVYGVWNALAIGSPVPISGVVKTFWSTQLRGAPPSLSAALGHAGVLLQSAQVRDGLLFGVPWLLLAALARRRLAGRPALRACVLFLAGLAILHVVRLAWFAWTTWPPFGSYAHYWITGRLLRYLTLAMVAGGAIAWFGARSWRRAKAVLSIVVALVVVGACAQVTWHRVQRGADPTADWEMASYRGALWLNQHLPEPVGAFDAGVLGYFGDAPVANWDGLSNSPAYAAAMRDGRADEFAWRSGIRHLANVVPADCTDIGAFLQWKWSLHRRPRGTFDLVHADEECCPIVDGQRMQFRVYRWRDG